jgi:hypothetical protein
MLHFIAAKSEKDFPEVNELVKDFEALPLACRGTHFPFDFLFTFLLFSLSTFLLTFPFVFLL